MIDGFAAWARSGADNSAPAPAAIADATNWRRDGAQQRQSVRRMAALP
jgi:hypothetical protein